VHTPYVHTPAVYTDVHAPLHPAAPTIHTAHTTVHTEPRAAPSIHTGHAAVHTEPRAAPSIHTGHTAIHTEPRAAPRPSLVVCPATLVSHWKSEASRYIGPLLETLEYAGPPAKRAILRAQVCSEAAYAASGAWRA